MGYALDLLRKGGAGGTWMTIEGLLHEMRNYFPANSNLELLETIYLKRLRPLSAGRSVSSERPSRSLILTALPVERDAVVRRLTNIENERHPTGIEYQIGTFRSLTVCVAQIAPGNTSAALETERAISFFQPNLALFVGIAGGVKDVTLGDVVAATKVYGYEAGADRDHFQPRPDVGLSSYPLIKEAETIARNGHWIANVVETKQGASPHVFVGPIAAGAKVVKSTRGAVAKLLKENYGDSLAVEMEGEGFLRLAYTNKVDAIVIRGISDFLDGKDVADSSGWQAIASERAAAFAFEILASVANQTVEDVATRASFNSDGVVTKRPRYYKFLGSATRPGPPFVSSRPRLY